MRQDVKLGRPVSCNQTTPSHSIFVTFWKKFRNPISLRICCKNGGVRYLEYPQKGLLAVLQPQSQLSDLSRRNGRRSTERNVKNRRGSLAIQPS
eukprot:Gb_04483 [translate_table: standard]